MPTVARIDGHRFFFFSNEGTEAPHIHVETAEKYAKFWLQDCNLAYSSGYNGKELTRLRKVVLDNRDSFLEAWHEYFDD